MADPVTPVELSVVIPARNAESTLGEQLGALSRQRWSGDWEVIVADNASTDSTIACARAYHQALPSLKVVGAAEKRGAAHARNVGARLARGRSVVFCDADDVVAEGWLPAMATALRERPFVASRFDFRALNPLWLSASRGDPQSAGLQVLEYPPHLHHSGGSGLGIRREIFQQIGGFDEALRFGQDTDLCIRVQLAGTPLTFAPDAVVRVRLPRASGRQFRQAYHWSRHNVRMYARYRPAGHRLYRPWRNYGTELRRLLTKVRSLGGPEARATWLFRAGWDLGLLVAAIEHRVPPMVYSSLRPPPPDPRAPVVSPETGTRGAL